MESTQPRFAPQIDNMSYILLVDDRKFFVPLKSPQELWSHKEFDLNLPLVILITGWETIANDTNNAALHAIYSAYRCRGNYNFVVCLTKKTYFLFISTIFNQIYSNERFFQKHFQIVDTG